MSSDDQLSITMMTEDRKVLAFVGIGAPGVKAYDSGELYLDGQAD